MRVCLFALTGFGNTVLAELVRMPIIEDIAVFTRKEKGEFPYYQCEQLVSICEQWHINTYVDRRLNAQHVYEDVLALNPDMILIATFDQKLPKRICDIPALGSVNIHPSLLPWYRGPTPTNWAIINGERETGITYHAVSDAFDMGPIFYQQKTSIESLVDGELRKKLALLSGEMLEPFLTMYINGKIKPRKQKTGVGSYFPKVTSKEGMSLLKSGRFNQGNMLRGLTPYPGLDYLGWSNHDIQK